MSNGDINSENALYYRLLELLPVSVLRDISGENLKKQENIEHLLDICSINQITEAFNNRFDICRQHTYLLNLRNPINPADVDLTNLFEDRLISTGSQHLQNQRNDFFFYQTTQTFASYRTGNFYDVNFLWPIKINITPELIIIHIVVLERTSETLKDYDFQGRHREDTEDELLRELISSIRRNNITIDRLRSLDINRGIKKLWSRNVIDTPRIQSKGSISSSLETMDSGYYVKRDYPDYYNEVIQKPLLKTAFHFLKHGNLFVNRFLTDPSFGFLGFIRYSKQGCINNVIGIILRCNK